jgi:hypothetical protein
MPESQVSIKIGNEDCVCVCMCGYGVGRTRTS